MVKCLICENKFSFRKGKIYCSKKCGDKAFTIKNKQQKVKYDAVFYSKNKQKIYDRSKKWRKENGQKRWLTDKTRIDNNPNMAYYKKAITLLKRYFKKGTTPKRSKTLAVLPFRFIDLKTKFVNNIPEGFTWDDFLNGKLHIDHKTPHSKFNYRTHNDPEFKECWSLDNLQLLEASKNISKQK